MGMKNSADNDMVVGQIDISKISFDQQSRYGLSKDLQGLKCIFVNKNLRASVFQMLENKMPLNFVKSNSQPGLSLWAILVGGSIRIDMGYDYVHLCELMNNHITVREMLGHDSFDRFHYKLETIENNISLFTPELLEEVNQIILQAELVPAKKRGRQCAAWAIRQLRC
jgi:hypothetical protein